MNNFELKKIKNTTTWLQNVGYAYGKPAGELKVGDIMGWNGGGTTEVTKIIRETEKTVTVEERWYDYDGVEKLTPRNLVKNRIVAIVENGKFRVANLTKDTFKYLV